MKTKFIIVFSVILIPVLLQGDNGLKSGLPLMLNLSTPVNEDNSLLLTIKAEPPIEKVLTEYPINTKFDMIVYYQDSGGNNYAKIAPMFAVFSSKMRDGPEKEHLYPIKESINLTQNFIDFIKKNKDMLETVDRIRKIQVRVALQGLQVEPSIKNSDFNSEVLYKARFFSPWITISPDYIAKIYP